MVAGIRTPQDLDTMKVCMPPAYKELVENCEILERHYKDMMVILRCPLSSLDDHYSTSMKIFHLSLLRNAGY